MTRLCLTAEELQALVCPGEVMVVDSGFSVFVDEEWMDRMSYQEELDKAQQRTQIARKALTKVKAELDAAMIAERKADRALLEHTLRKEMGAREVGR